MKESEIIIKVKTDENHLPEEMKWKASDSGMNGENQCKAMMLALWDSNIQNTYRIDLWVKDMPVDQMKLFFYQTLVSMSETLSRSTGEESMAEEMLVFCRNFAKKMEIST